MQYYTMLKYRIVQYNIILNNIINHMIQYHRNIIRNCYIKNHIYMYQASLSEVRDFLNSIYDNGDQGMYLTLALFFKSRVPDPDPLSK